MSVKPARSRRSRVSSGPAKCLRPSKLSPMSCERGLDARDVAAPAALRDELRAGPHHGREVREQPVVVGDPVEGGRRQDGVDRRIDRQRLEQVGHEVREALLAEALPSERDHRGAAVEGDDLAVRQPLAQHRRHLAGPAAGVQHPLVPAEVEPVDDDAAPPRHGRGQPVVGGGVPVPRSSSPEATAGTAPRSSRSGRPAPGSSTARRRAVEVVGGRRDVPGELVVADGRVGVAARRPVVDHDLRAVGDRHRPQLRVVVDDVVRRWAPGPRRRARRRSGSPPRPCRSARGRR